MTPDLAKDVYRSSAPRPHAHCFLTTALRRPPRPPRGSYAGSRPGTPRALPAGRWLGGEVRTAPGSAIFPGSKIPREAPSPRAPDPKPPKRSIRMRRPHRRTARPAAPHQTRARPHAHAFSHRARRSHTGPQRRTGPSRTRMRITFHGTRARARVCTCNVRTGSRTAHE